MSQVERSIGIHELPSDCYPPTDSDDESFVVLERCTGPDVVEHVEQKPEFISPDVIDQSLELATEVMSLSMRTTGASSLPAQPIVDRTADWLTSLSTVSSDISPEEIQKNVDSLITENANLRRTIHQNNLAMKNQYETLIQWQKDVERVHDSHKKKFLDTKTYIKELQKENARLSALVKDPPASSTLSSIKSLINESTDEENKKREDDFQKALQILKQELQLKDEELANIKLKYDSDSKQIEENATAKIKDLETAMESLKLTYEKKCTELNKENKEYQYNLAKLQDDAASLKLLKIQMAEKEEEHDQKKQSLLEQITTLKITCEKLKANQVTEEAITNLKSQLSAAQACIINLKQHLKEKNAEIEILNSDMLLQKTDADRVVAIEQQLTLYKSDFEEERESRNRIIIEKNQIIEDFQNLQRRNEELLKEVETLRSVSTFVEVGHERPAGAAASPPPTAPSTQQRPEKTPSPELMTYKCPICMKKFRSPRVLEEHVDSCLNETWQ